MNEKLINALILASIMFLIVGGMVLIWKSVGWMPAVGSFMMLWGHYVEKHREKKEVVTTLAPETRTVMEMIAKLRGENYAKNILGLHYDALSWVNHN